MASSFPGDGIARPRLDDLGALLRTGPKEGNAWPGVAPFHPSERMLFSLPLLLQIRRAGHAERD